MPLTVAGVEQEATPPETASCGAVTQKPSSISNEEVVSMVERLMKLALLMIVFRGSFSCN